MVLDGINNGTFNGTSFVNVNMSFFVKLLIESHKTHSAPLSRCRGSLKLIIWEPSFFMHNGSLLILRCYYHCGLNPQSHEITNQNPCMGEHSGWVLL